MAAIGPDHLDAEGELLDHVVDEVDGVGLIVPVVDLQGPDACGVVDGGVLVPLDRGAIFVFERQELDVDLDMVPWDPLLIPGCMNCPTRRCQEFRVRAAIMGKKENPYGPTQSPAYS